MTFVHFPDANVDVNLDAALVIYQHRTVRNGQPPIELELAHRPERVGLYSSDDCAILRQVLMESQWRPKAELAHSAITDALGLFEGIEQGRGPLASLFPQHDAPPPEVTSVDAQRPPWVRVSSGHLGIPIDVRAYYHPRNDDGLAFCCRICEEISHGEHVAVYLGTRTDAIATVCVACLPTSIRNEVWVAIGDGRGQKDV